MEDESRRTDLEKQNHELAEEVARLRLFIELTSDALALSEDGVILDCNETLCRIIGYARDEVIGRRIVTLVMPEDREKVREHVSKNSDEPYEHRMMRKDGSIFDAAITARRTVYQGRTLRATSIRDLTTLKQAERALTQAQEEKLHAQAMLLAELSTPLIPINDRVLVMPLIGSIDSQRAQQVLETLLGAQVVLTGIRADVAQTLVRLGVNLDELTTKATLQSGIAFAIAHTS